MDFGFLVENMGRNSGKNVSKNLSGKHNQKLLNHDKQSATDVLKNASQKAIQKTTEATGGLMGNNIVGKITKFLRM